MIKYIKDFSHSGEATDDLVDEIIDFEVVVVVVEEENSPMSYVRYGVDMTTDVLIDKLSSVLLVVMIGIIADTGVGSLNDVLVDV